MIAKNIQPNLATYNGLVEGTAMEARPDLARSIMEEMNKKRIRPNASTLTYVVSALLNVKLR
jgi:pentatricopeptide repeat protein